MVLQEQRHGTHEQGQAAPLQETHPTWPGAPVETCRKEVVPRRVERYARDGVSVSGVVLQQGISGARVPDLDCVVHATCGEGRPVGRETHARYVVRVVVEHVAACSCKHSSATLVGRREGWSPARSNLAAPVSASHKRTVLSSLAEAMALASGLNTADRTQFAWPLNDRTKRLEGMAHILTVLSSDAVRRCCESQLKSTLRTVAAWHFMLSLWPRLPSTGVWEGGRHRDIRPRG